MLPWDNPTIVKVVFPDPCHSRVMVKVVFPDPRYPGIINPSFCSLPKGQDLKYLVSGIMATSSGLQSVSNQDIKKVLWV